MDAHIHQMEDGPPAAADTTFVPGETVYVSFQVEGYRVSPEQKVHLSYRIDAVDPKGIRIVEPVESSVDAALAPEDKNWKPKARQSMLVPPIAPAGAYRVSIRVTDDLDHDTATQDVTFAVSGHHIPVSPTLSVANFGFFRAEEDPEPLKTAAYRPGDALWARFDIVGYKFGEGNSIQVSYGVAVLSSAGKTLYSQPEAALEKSFSFYPKPYIPGSMNLSLQPNMRPGEYAIVLTVRDVIGQQNFEAKHIFRVE
ncbi:MAG: hypothetical protein M3Z36_14865 [Acidobacteriota bacterium]|nr:hypothetical protein [Acidobacteriota bacterium]